MHSNSYALPAQTAPKVMQCCLVASSEHDPALCLALALGVETGCLAGDKLIPGRLLKWNAETLHAHGRELLVLGNIGQVINARGQLLHAILALAVQAKWDEDDILVVERRKNFFP